MTALGVGVRSPSRAVLRVTLAAALIFTVLVSGSESGGLVTPVMSLGAALGALLIAVYLWNVPRRHDRVDQLVLVAYVLFLAACVFSSIPRISFESATSGLAYVALFYVARRAVKDREGREFAITVLGLLGTGVAAIHLVLWGAVWLQWLSLPAAGSPPFNLMLPTAQYHPIRAALLVALLLPATVLLTRRPGIWPIGLIGTASSVGVIVMSGSRTTWLALGTALVVLAVLSAKRSGRVPRVMALGAVAALAGGAIAAYPQLISRLGTSSTIELRFAMWSDSLRLWLDSPLTGTGPGTFASAFVLTGHYNRYEPYVPHAHNIPVQLLLEAGVVGLIGVAVLIFAIAQGMRQSGRRETAAIIAITVFAAASLTETPTHGAFLVVPLIVWTAILLPATQAAGQATATKRWLRALHTSLAVGVAVAVVATLAAAAAHDRAATAAAVRRDAEVLRELRTAVALDPSFALYRRELGIWLLPRDVEAVLTELEAAVQLNRGDQAAIRALAVARAEAQDAGGSIAAARATISRARHHPENWLALAYVGTLAGETDATMEGFVGATRRVPWILAAPEWDVVFPGSPKEEVLRAAHESWDGSTESSYRNARARAWLSGIAGEVAPADISAALLAESAVLYCRPDIAAGVLTGLDTFEATTGDALQARLLYQRAFSVEVNRATQRLIQLRNPSLARQAFGGVIGDPLLSDYRADVNLYRRIPIALPGPIFPTGASGLSRWLQDPVGAADIGAPGSALAECR